MPATGRTISPGQLHRDRRAVLTVLGQHAEPVGYATVALAAGEELGAAFDDLIAHGEIEMLDVDDCVRYRLATRH